jgi:hypothetical protein
MDDDMQRGFALLYHPSSTRFLISFPLDSCSSCASVSAEAWSLRERLGEAPRRQRKCVPLHVDSKWRCPLFWTLVMLLAPISFP